MGKRLLDIGFALFGLVVTAPLIIVIALLISWDSPGGIFYAPIVVGQDGKTFRFFRFRTMYADKRTQSRKGKQLTRVGRWIQNYSLDHLPGMVNLLKGDVTLVGPRPMEVDVVDMSDPTWQRYFQVKPGLVNYAIVQLGKEWTPIRTKQPALNQELELEYIEQQSSWFDLHIFLKFIQGVFSSKGNIKMRGEVDPALKHKVEQTRES